MNFLLEICKISKIFKIQKLKVWSLEFWSLDSPGNYLNLIRNWNKTLDAIPRDCKKTKSMIQKNLLCTACNHCRKWRHVELSLYAKSSCTKEQNPIKWPKTSSLVHSYINSAKYQQRSPTFWWSLVVRFQLHQPE